MKIFKNIYGYCVVAVIAATSLSTAFAQENTSGGGTNPAARERMKMERLWFNNTNNAAGIRVDNTRYYSEFGLGYSYDSGDFTRPQAGTSIRDIAFSTEGGGDVGGFYAWGSFDYVNNVTRNTLYNMSAFDPFRGNPYILADYSESDWYKQMFNLRMNVSTPKYFGDRAAFGLDVEYMSNTGAKQVDPRPKIDLYRIIIRPALIYNITPSHTIGLNLEYHNLREEANISNSSIIDTKKIAVMRGFGFFYEENFTQELRFSKANGIGGALQFSYSGNWKFIAAAGISREIEKVLKDPTRPLSRGNLDAMRYNLRGTAILYGRQADMHVIGAAFTRSSTDGIEDVVVQEQTSNGATKNVIVDRNVRSNYKSTTISGSYDYIRSDDPDDYAWKLGLTAHYGKVSDIYYLPESTRAYSNMKIGLNGAYNFMRGSSWRLLLAGEANYNMNLDGEMELNVPTPDHQIITGLMQPDFAYLTTEYVRCRLSLTASMDIGRNDAGCAYLTVSYDLMKPTKTRSAIFSTSDNRSCLQFSVGCMF